METNVFSKQQIKGINLPVCNGNAQLVGHVCQTVNTVHCCRQQIEAEKMLCIKWQSHTEM